MAMCTILHGGKEDSRTAILSSYQMFILTHGDSSWSTKQLSILEDVLIKICTKQYLITRHNKNVFCLPNYKILSFNNDTSQALYSDYCTGILFTARSNLH